MYAVTVTIEVFPHRMAEFLPAILANARAARDEPACRRFDVLSDPARPDEVFLYELYDDASGHAAHRRTGHFRAFDATVAEMIRRRSAVTYETVET